MYGYTLSREDNSKRTHLRITARPMIIFQNLFLETMLFLDLPQSERARIIFCALFEFVEAA